MNPSTSKGFTVRIGQYHFRLWRGGFEIGNRLGGDLDFLSLFINLNTGYTEFNAFHI